MRPSFLPNIGLLFFSLHRLLCLMKVQLSSKCLKHSPCNLLLNPRLLPTLHHLVLFHIFPPPQLHVTTATSLLEQPHDPLSTASVSSLQAVPSSTVPQQASSSPASHQMVTCSKTGSQWPKNCNDYQLLYSTRHPLRTLHSPITTTTPSCFSEASKSPEWSEAMNQEFDALLTTKTWSLCLLPAGCHAVENKWVYKLLNKSRINLLSAIKHVSSPKDLIDRMASITPKPLAPLSNRPQSG